MGSKFRVVDDDGLELHVTTPSTETIFRAREDELRRLMIDLVHTLGIESDDDE